MADAGTYLVVRDAGHFRVEQLDSAFFVEHRDDGKGEEDDSHTANEVGDGSPQQDSFWQ